jgi:hypothetical protein
VNDLGPTQGGPGPVPGVQSVLAKVLDPARRFGLCIQGSGTFPWGSGPTVDTMEYIVSSGHVAAPVLSTWRNQALFTSWLKAVAWTPRLHTVVRGTTMLIKTTFKRRLNYKTLEKTETIKHFSFLRKTSFNYV